MIGKILICDDDNSVRQMLRELLEMNHHHVIEATDGAQAFAMAEAHRPHLIIMDIVMPGLYGTTATKKIHEYKETADIPIIIFSGSADKTILDKVGIDLEKEHVTFLHKSSNPKIILETIRTMLPKGGYTQ